MSWRVVVQPEAGDDVTKAAAWYGSQQEGLGDEFREEVIHSRSSQGYEAHFKRGVRNSKSEPRCLGCDKAIRPR